MFRMQDIFNAYDKNKQPYSFTVERHTETDNLHAGVTEEGFSLKSVGNRHILNTPKFHTGTFFMEFKVTFIKEFAPEFLLLFHYQEEKRIGKGIRVRYRLNGMLELELVSVESCSIVVHAKQTFANFYLTEDRFIPFTLEICEDRVICRVDKGEGVFLISNGIGKLAIERSNFIGELILKQVAFETMEEFKSHVVIPQVTAEIPLINGGDIPYTITWQVEEVEGEFYLRCALDGGTKTRPVNRDDRMGQYNVEMDWMETPYVGIRNFGTDYIYNISEGINCFIDPNIYWECQKAYFGDTDLPLQTCYKVDVPEIDGQAEIIFGYEKLTCSHYRSQYGGNEFRFSADGELLYSGEALDGRDSFAVYSPFDKLALSFIPEVCYKREEVVEHFKYNHYFDVSEKPAFQMEFCTRKDPAYFTVKAKLFNVFETITMEECSPKVQTEAWRNGYVRLLADAEFASLPIGVYKIVFEVLYSEKLYKRVMHVFEVYDKDSDVNPALATGLPFTFSMPNEHKWLERQSFDMWNPARSCDVEHYITCVTDTPIEALRRKVWELIKPFKREWFAWLGARTCNDFLSDRYDDIKRHADYLFYGMDSGTDDWLGACSIFPFRGDHWVYDRVNNPMQQEVMKKFYEKHPEALEVTGYRPGEGKMPQDAFEKFMEHYKTEWMDDVNERAVQIFEKQNEELNAINPGVRRSIYGPFSQYVTPTLTYHCLQVYGVPCDSRLAEKLYTGFAIFEDYPYSCAYQTYRAPFAVMTILLHVPGLVIYPEQYQGSNGGCIDGAVKFAHAPMGKYVLEAYQNSTQAFEYVYNTPYRTKEGFHYWEKYGFHRSDYGSDFMDQLIMDWEHVVRSKPIRPLKSLAFIVEYDTCDDVFKCYRCENNERKYTISNRSEIGSGLIHECSRLAGVPNGFALKFDTLNSLVAKECDLLVVPSLKGASKEQVAEIRRLYEEGVNLIAVSDVTGLEDLFGVKEQINTAKVNSVTYGAKTENVYETETDFRYIADGAEVIMTANGILPVILQTKRTTLVNADMNALGCEDPKKVSVACANHIVGTNIRKVLQDEIIRLSCPLVQGENVGVTLYETQDGRTEVLAIDYRPYENQENVEREAVVKLNLDGVTEVFSKKELFVGKKDGMVREIRFMVKAHESVFLELYV